MPQTYRTGQNVIRFGLYYDCIGTQTLYSMSRLPHRVGTLILYPRSCNNHIFARCGRGCSSDCLHLVSLSLLTSNIPVGEGGQKKYRGFLAWEKSPSERQQMLKNMSPCEVLQKQCLDIQKLRSPPNQPDSAIMKSQK